MSQDIYEVGYVKELFDKMSGSYERVNLITSFGFSHRWRWQSIEALTPKSGTIEVLDLLTGMGENWSFIKRRFPGCNLNALDFSEGMLTYAMRRNNRHFSDSVVLLQEDALQNGLPDQKYDLITCSYGLKTFRDDQLKVLAKQVHRLLKPGGQFSFVEVSKPMSRWLSVPYGFYLGNIIPVLGWLLAGNPESYRMLWTYTKRFQHVGAALNTFREAGLKVEMKQYFWGCATGITGSKPEG